MLYTIDIENLTGINLYRLNTEGQFINIAGRKSKEIVPGDMIINRYQSAQLYKSNMAEMIVVDGQEVQCNSEDGLIYALNVEINMHRTQKPTHSLFTREQIYKVLLLGNDNRNNSLIIDFDGKVNLIPFEDISKKQYAVRYGSFAAGNGYVGVLWNDYEIEDLYECLLQGWYKHLSEDEIVFINVSNGTSAEKSIKDILEILE